MATQYIRSMLNSKRSRHISAEKLAVQQRKDSDPPSCRTATIARSRDSSVDAVFHQKPLPLSLHRLLSDGEDRTETTLAHLIHFMPQHYCLMKITASV